MKATTLSKSAPNAGQMAARLGLSLGLLLAALYDPVWTSAILAPRDFILALGAFTLLVFWKLPPWLVVMLTAGGGGVMDLTLG